MDPPAQPRNQILALEQVLVGSRLCGNLAVDLHRVLDPGQERERGCIGVDRADPCPLPRGHDGRPHRFILEVGNLHRGSVPAPTTVRLDRDRKYRLVRQRPIPLDRLSLLHRDPPERKTMSCFGSPSIIEGHGAVPGSPWWRQLYGGEHQSRAIVGLRRRDPDERVATRRHCNRRWITRTASCANARTATSAVTSHLPIATESVGLEWRLVTADEFVGPRLVCPRSLQTTIQIPWEPPE